MSRDLHNPIWVTVLSKDHEIFARSHASKEAAALTMVQEMGVRLNPIAGLDSDALSRFGSLRREAGYDTSSVYKISETHQSASREDDLSLSPDSCGPRTGSFIFPKNSQGHAWIVACNRDGQNRLIVRPDAHSAGIAMATEFGLSEEKIAAGDDDLIGMLHDAYQEDGWNGLAIYKLNLKNGRMDEISMDSILDMISAPAADLAPDSREELVMA